MIRLLLVNPDSNADLTSYGALANGALLGRRAFMAPLPLATIAALTPEDVAVDIWDEPVHSRLEQTTRLPDYDLVGVTGYACHAQRARSLAKLFRGRGATVVVGGPGVSSLPEAYRDHFDVLFIGEAEHTWPQFLKDWRAGTHLQEYRQISKPDLSSSPPPRWAPLADVLKQYLLGAVQTTRGCPFDCEFCDVIFLYGRQPRHKPIDRVLSEVCTLEQFGVESIFFCDDNFIGNPRYAKELLRGLIAVNQGFDCPLSFTTQITLNVARDEGTLALLADANFSGLYIGIESPNKESLQETNKPQNYRTDILQDIRRIQSYGLPVRAGMVVGFDHDGPDIFARQLDFVQEACIPVVTVNMLKAPPGTKLWSRLLADRRVVAAADGLTERLDDMTYGDTNIVPKLMTRQELMVGFRRLLAAVNSWDHFYARLLGFISTVQRPPQVPSGRPTTAGGSTFLRRLFLAIGEPEGVATVLGALAATQRIAPYLMEKVVGLILQFLGVRALALALDPVLEEQIAAEARAGGVGAYIDQRPIPIPPTFRHSYDSLFAKALKQVTGGLLDRTRVPQALVEIFTDFLVRWGATFEELQDHHWAELDEITARTVAAANRAFMPGQDACPGEIIPGPRDALQLRQETLKCVERDLRRMAGTRPEVPPAYHPTSDQQGTEVLVPPPQLRPRPRP